MGVVDVVPVEAVIEAESSCADRARAEAMLSASLAAARGPRRTPDDDRRWRLSMKVASAAAGTKSAAAQLSDDRGELVSERMLSVRTTGSCIALARAVGAWAQLVLDDELARAETHPEEHSREAESPPIGSPPLAPAHLLQRAESRDAAPTSPAEPRASRAVDIGTTAFLRTGAASIGSTFGVAPFVTIELTERWVLRPSVLYGRSTSRIPRDEPDGATLTALGGRLDACGRVPGKYIHQQRLEVDICIGGDALHVWSHQGSLTRGSIGPSGTIRGKLGHGLAIELRTMAGVALDTRAIGPDEPAPRFLTAFELGGSMRF